MSVYLIAAVDKTNPKEYAAYETGAAASIQQYGIEVMVVDDAPKLVEGTLPGSRIVVLRADNQEAMDRWVNSPEYQAVVPVRQAHGRTAFLATCRGFGAP